MNWHDAFNEILFPSAVLDHFLLSYLAIATALIVKFFFVRKVTKLTWPMCLLADVTINAVSLLIGMLLIPLAGIVWQFFPGQLIQNYIMVGDYNLGLHIWPFIAWLFALTAVVVINAWFETVTLRLVFNQGDFGEKTNRNIFRCLCAANIPVVAVAFGGLLVHLIWTTTRDAHILFDFIGWYLDTALLFVIGIVGLLYYPYRTEKEIESGKRSELDGEESLKKLKRLCYFCILFSFIQSPTFFRSKFTAPSVNSSQQDNDRGITLQVDVTQIVLPAGWRKLDQPANLYVQQIAANSKKGIVLTAGVIKSDKSVEQFADTSITGLKQGDEVLDRKYLDISSIPTVEIDEKHISKQSGKNQFIRAFIFAGNHPKEIVMIGYAGSSEDIFQDQSLVDFIQRPAKAN